jgi:hypothetical protein
MRLIQFAALAVSFLSAASAAPFAPAPARETKVVYTFEGSCDGLALKQKSDGTAQGRHIGSCLHGDYAGGLRTTIKGKTVWVIITTETGIDSEMLMIVLDEAALTFKIYIMQNQSQKFVLRNSGTLTVGAPPDATPFGKTVRTASGVIVKR